MTHEIADHRGKAWVIFKVSKEVVMADLLKEISTLGDAYAIAKQDAFISVCMRKVARFSRQDPLVSNQIGGVLTIAGLPKNGNQVTDMWLQYLASMLKAAPVVYTTVTATSKTVMAAMPGGADVGVEIKMLEDIAEEWMGLSERDILFRVVNGLCWCGCD